MLENDWQRLWPALIVLLIIGVAFALMALSWRARHRRQAFLDVVPTSPDELGEVTHREKLLYLATTLAGEPLERVVVGGLGFRARAELLVTNSGVVLALAGRPPAFIPLVDIRGVGLASWAIDRGVGDRGLIFIRWVLGDTAVDSYLRPEDPDSLLEVLSALSSQVAGTTNNRRD